MKPRAAGPRGAMGQSSPAEGWGRKVFFFSRVFGGFSVSGWVDPGGGIWEVRGFGPAGDEMGFRDSHSTLPRIDVIPGPCSSPGLPG